jgi:hypothetical protein
MVPANSPMLATPRDDRAPTDRRSRIHDGKLGPWAFVVGC